MERLTERGRNTKCFSVSLYVGPMSKTVAPYNDRRRQPVVVVVGGTKDELTYISNAGDCVSGPPEEVWKALATKEKYFRSFMDRGKERTRYVEGSPPIVIAAKRGSIRDLVRTCDARHWEGVRATHGRYKTLIHDGGPTVRRLGVTADLEPAADGLFRFVQFCSHHGVRFSGSIAGAGYSLFRTTLKQPFTLWAPDCAIGALWPGRREYWHSPRLWRDMAYYDIKAAYPAALSQDLIPTHWDKVEPANWRKHPNGFSVARALTPSDASPPYPLPLHLRLGTRRESISWASGAFAGVWPHLDMLNAADLDTWIEADETWVPTRYTDVFASDEWQSLRAEMRGLPGLAGTLGKMADNGLWGMFAFDNSQDIRIRWNTSNGDMSKITETRKMGIRSSSGMGIALAATARVRQKLWQGIRASGAIYCDTDGIICPIDNPPSLATGLDGSWVLKDRMDLLDVNAPQSYRWINGADTDWHYIGGSERDFHSAPIIRGQLHGDESGTAPAMSVRVAHIRKLM